MTMFLGARRIHKSFTFKVRSFKELVLFTKCYSSDGGMTSAMNVFNRKVKRLQKDRAARSPDTDDYDYLKDEIACRLVDRLDDVSRTFPLALDLGCNKGHLSKYLTSKHFRELIQCDISSEMLHRSFLNPVIPTKKLLVDEEFLPFKADTFDAVVSSLSLHWVNELPNVFKQVYKSLKNDGMFLACLFGGQTLFELRSALQLAEVEQEGGFGPHVSPFTEMADVGGLLSQAGFNTITVDSDELIVKYPSIHELMADLRGMGENNASLSRKYRLKAGTVEAAAKIYKDMYGDEHGHIPATFDIIFLIGWKAGRSPVKRTKPSTEQFSLRDIDNIEIK